MTPALWTDELRPRAPRAYGLTVSSYKKNNLLKTEFPSRTWRNWRGNVLPLFAKPPRPRCPVDGGNERVV